MGVGVWVWVGELVDGCCVYVCVSNSMHAYLHSPSAKGVYTKSNNCKCIPYIVSATRCTLHNKDTTKHTAHAEH